VEYLVEVQIRISPIKWRPFLLSVYKCMYNATYGGRCTSYAVLLGCIGAEADPGSGGEGGEARALHIIIFTNISIAFREEDVTTGAALYSLISELSVMLGETPGIVLLAYLGFLTR
jgi:hypothetical protein